MSEIKIIRKPDFISFQQIHDLLYVAHEINRKEKGFDVSTAHMSPEELEVLIGKNGQCFVAMDGERLVGTTSYRIVQRNYWCAKGDVVDRILAAVHPDYKGRHISTMLFNQVVQSAKEMGYKYIESVTAENNDIVQMINLKDGYRYIDFKAPKTDHFNVVMLQWLNGCPYSKAQTDLYFDLKRFFIKMRYKPGRIKRFGI